MEFSLRVTRRRFALIGFWLLLFAGIRLTAQDVTVGPMNLMPSDKPVDELPRPKRAFRPAYPSEMKRSDETGYILVMGFVAEDGKLRSADVGGGPHPFRAAVEARMRDWKLVPAKDDGKAVDAWFWMPVIFNPASAAAGGAGTRPRLIEVTPVLLDFEKNESPQDRRGGVRTRISVGPTGAVEAVTVLDDEPERTRTAIGAAVRTWRFEPARREGQAVAADIELEVVVRTRLLPVQAKGVPPQILKQDAPVYPAAMNFSRMRGEVVVEMVIDRQGNVQNAVIKTSSNPGFDEAALETVRKWKFKPAEINGRVASAKVIRSIIFEFPGGGGNDAFVVSTKNHDKNYQPPKPRGVVLPVYPYGLLAEKIRSKVSANLVIDPEGEVVGVDIKQVDRPELGFAMAAAMETFVFEPALKDGRPSTSVLQVEQKFDYRNVPDDDLYRREQKKPESIVGAGALDAPPQPVSRRSPVFPLSAQVASVGEGQALIEFLVDEDGKVCLPRIVKATHPAFGYAAVQAISVWRFAPPKAKGRPTVVRLRAPFEFKQAQAGK